jgi:methyltransferase (TIGR00027 family)
MGMGMEATRVSPDSSAVRTALWRAMHLQVDAPPHVLSDDVGLRMVAPGEDWRGRRDMNPDFTRHARASIVARARYIEDLVVEQVGRGVRQYVLLGAGLDTFAQRHPDLASCLSIFEVDRPGPQNWKRQRLVDLGFGVPDELRLVPIDFQLGGPWWERLIDCGFDGRRPAVVTSAGVTTHLTRDAIGTALRQVADLAPGSTLVMTFRLPPELVESDDRPLGEAAAEVAAAAGAPLLSFFAPAEMLALARESGFRNVWHVSARDLTARYFGGRSDGLRPSNGEELLVART